MVLLLVETKVDETVALKAMLTAARWAALKAEMKDLLKVAMTVEEKDG